MHFSWKKSKVARISRLVAGLHKTPKRGGSLMVETGFPTSLIDLFVKNRDRLRKSSKRKYNAQIVLSDPTRSHPLPPPCNQIPSPDTDVRELVSITREKNEDEIETKKNEKNKIEFHLVFKISLMVAFAVSTKSLANWIMTTAFLLVLIELFGSRFPTPGSKSRSNDLVLEREAAKFRLIELEEGLKTETTTRKSERSRSARIIISLIKKLVPKKLRYGNKKNKGKLEKEDEETESETELIIVPTTTRDRISQVESSEKEKNLRKKGNSGYVIPFIIVILAGLTGGKSVALLLTLLCWLMILIDVYSNTKKQRGFR